MSLKEPKKKEATHEVAKDPAQRHQSVISWWEGGGSSSAPIERFAKPAAVTEQKRCPRDTSRMMGEGDMVRVVYTRTTKSYSPLSFGTIYV